VRDSTEYVRTHTVYRESDPYYTQRAIFCGQIPQPGSHFGDSFCRDNHTTDSDSYSEPHHRVGFCMGEPDPKVRFHIVDCNCNQETDDTQWATLHSWISYIRLHFGVRFSQGFTPHGMATRKQITYTVLSVQHTVVQTLERDSTH
jgi:hypothetical protein